MNKQTKVAKAMRTHSESAMKSIKAPERAIRQPPTGAALEAIAKKIGEESITNLNANTHEDKHMAHTMQTKMLCLASRMAGNNFAERLSTIVVLFCSVVVVNWLIFDSDFYNRPVSIFEAVWPGTGRWHWHPVGWACKVLS